MTSTQENEFMSLSQIKKKWQSLPQVYCYFDASIHSYYHQLIHLMKINEATNIYEIGCGRGLLIPYTMAQKPLDAGYLAIDISETMVHLARENVRTFLKTMPVHIDEEAYYNKNKLQIQCSDGQKTIQPQGPFDRIISNLVLMLTEDPIQMMRTFHQQAKEGCLLGITVSGDEEAENFMVTLPQKIKKRLGEDISKPKHYHVLYNRLEEVGQQTGWELLASWDQKVPEGFFELDATLKTVLTQWQSFSRGVLQELLQEIEQIFNRKEIMYFNAKMAIFRKK